MLNFERKKFNLFIIKLIKKEVQSEEKKSIWIIKLRIEIFMYYNYIKIDYSFQKKEKNHRKFALRFVQIKDEDKIAPMVSSTLRVVSSGRLVRQSGGVNSLI